MQKKEQEKILELMCIYVFMQPFFDILSNLYVDGIIKYGISTIIKPIFIFIISFYVFLKYNKRKKSWIIYGAVFCVFLIGHYFILKNIYVPNDMILHEFRFILNIVYMILSYLIFSTLFNCFEDKSYLLKKLKIIVLSTFLLYCVLLLVGVITGTSGLTYEYADSLKQGFKGWYDSGQIFGHALSIMLPLLIYISLKPRNKLWLRIFLTLVIFTCICLIGTRVPFLILIIVLTLYIIISFYNLIRVSYYKFNLFNIIYCFVCLISLIVVYNYLPVAENVRINKNAGEVNLSSYSIEEIDGSNNVEYLIERKESNKNHDTTELEKYIEVAKKAGTYLYKKYINGEVHPSEMRKVEYYYVSKKFEYLPLKYKIFGVGFLNQETYPSLESDSLMALFSYGILGFICVLGIPLLEFIKSTMYMFKNVDSNDLETYLLYMGFGIFFCISFFAGYTYIYTNFSIFLVLLIIILRCKIHLNYGHIKLNKKLSKISFLMLHLGYGGIETATINTANALSKYYDVELISFYSLSKNQISNVNKNIKIKFLYKGEPNREKIKEAVESKNVFKVFIEGFKSIKILTLKRLLIIIEIFKSKSDVLISTRMEFNTLLSRYGKADQLKIAQEHRHHNNDKKYINTIKNKYQNIDYLFALTESLKKDYEKFLSNTSSTKVFVVPNMIKSSKKHIKGLTNRDVISVGRLHPGKKIPELVEIFSKSSILDNKLYIIGDGEEFNEVSEIVKKKKLTDRVKLLGYLNQEQIEKYLLSSNLFLMTSETEGLPMVLLEAMNYGLPCIAYETDSGTKDIIDDGKNGYLIKNRDQKAFIKNMDSLLNNKTLFDKLSKEAYKTAQKFNEENIVNIWIKIFNME